jgi:hypothetical protein
MLKRKMKNIFIKLSLFGAAFLILFSFLSGAFIAQDKNSVSAASVPVAEIKDRVSNFTALYLLANNSCSYKDSITAVDATNNNIGYDTTSTYDQHASGYSFDGTNHQWGCQDMLGDNGVANLWKNATGHKDDTIGFLKAIGYSCSGNPEVCNNPNGYTDNSETTDNSTIVSKLVSLLKTSNPNIMDGIDVSGTNVTPSTAIKYAAWYEAFTASSSNGGCGAALVSSYDKGTPDDQAAALSGNDGSGDTYAINSVNADGSVSLNIYRGQGAGTQIGVINGVGSVNGDHADCHEAADVLFESTDSKNGNWTSNPSMKNSSDSWAQAFAAVVASGDNSAKTIVVNGNTQSGSVSSSPYDKCFINIPVIGWLMCGMLSIADQFYTWIQRVIGDYLLMRGTSGGHNPLDSGQPLYKGWATIKNISSVLILLVGLFMILSQVFSFEFMSAYTVKKVLPRLLVATIAIQFSWDIFTGLIYLVDALGSGVQSLLVSPFAKLVPSATNGNTIGLNSILGISGSGAANGGIFAGLLALGGFATFAGGYIAMTIAAIGVTVTCFTVYFTLIIRYILIVALLLLSPIALVMWVLPGTQSLWKNWWSNYSKLLFMYPMIMLLFSAGSIGAYIISTSGVAYAQFAAIVAYFGPLFLIPATFKYAGSAMAAASGGVSKLGGMVKEKNPASKSLAKAAGRRQEGKEEKAYRNTTDPNSRINRIRGGFSTGMYGATGDFKNKVAAEQKRKDFANAQLEAENLIKGTGDDDKQRDSRMAILNAVEGSTVTLANGKKVVASQRLQQATSLDAAKNKQHDALFAYEAKNKGALKKYASTNSEAFSVLDNYAPGFTRGDEGGHISRADSKAFQPAVNNFENIGGTAQEEVSNVLISQLQSPEALDRGMAMDNLTKIARNGDVSATDLGKLQKQIQAVTGSPLDLLKLRTSPTARIDNDPATGLPTIIQP